LSAFCFLLRQQKPIFEVLNLFFMSDLSQEAWASQLEKDSNAVILDVRTADEIAEGVIPGAQHLDIFLGQGFLDGLEALDKSKNYYVYCRSGNRSGQACALMQSVGFESAFNLEGGFMNWDGDTGSI